MHANRCIYINLCYVVHICFFGALCQFGTLGARLGRGYGPYTRAGPPVNFFFPLLHCSIRFIECCCQLTAPFTWDAKLVTSNCLQFS